MIDDITVVLLAAGDSTRLWPLSEKQFLQFCGVSLIQRSINQLAKVGIKKVLIVSNPKNFIESEKLIGANGSLDLKVIVQDNKRGLAGAVISACSALATKEIIVVSPSDVVEDYLFSDFLDIYKTGPDGVFTGKYLENYEPFGFYSLNNDRVTNIEEKPPKTDKMSKIAAIVLDYYKDAGILATALKNAKSEKDDIYETAKNQLINQGQVFKLLSYNGYWGYLKFPWHVLSLSNFFLSQIKKGYNKAKIDGTAKIVGPVAIEEGVSILENVKIVGPAYIGKGTIIGQNSLVRDSVIGDNSIIGFNTEITRSYVGNNCWFHHNYIGDSVISDNTSFGFGAVVANYRLDGETVSSNIESGKVDSGRTKLGVVTGKNSRIGVNSALMPGVKIGRGAFVGSMVSLISDLPDLKYVELRKDNYRVLDNRIKGQNSKIEENRSKLKF